MNNELNLFHKILFLELRPWANREFSEAKFKELLNAVKKEDFAFQPVYELSFLKPLSNKRKYYHALIENEAIRYLNAIYSIFDGAYNDEEKHFWSHDTLNKVMAQKLTETAARISEHNYFLSTLTNPLEKPKADTNTLDEIYILQLLKFQLIRIYLELQTIFNGYLKEDAYTEAELNEIYFSETLPQESFLLPAKKINKPVPASQVTAKQNEVQFKVKAFDFRDVKKGIIPYTDLIKDPNRFSRFEEELFSQEFIDEDYNFKNIHGQKQILAASFHVLIKKGYFNKFKFPGKIPIKPLDIRKFLDYRYNSDTDKQFRTWANNVDELASLIDHTPWLDRIPTS
ncbi:MAG: hypothetical protein EAY81_03945 [Bacteroidetes bacterium]|nr:MAG: hypothetical protein EAY81_03945 [Bacteroidota bacterium]